MKSDWEDKERSFILSLLQHRNYFFMTTQKFGLPSEVIRQRQKLHRSRQEYNHMFVCLFFLKLLLLVTNQRWNLRVNGSFNRNGSDISVFLQVVFILLFLNTQNHWRPVMMCYQLISIMWPIFFFLKQQEALHFILPYTLEPM